MMKILKAVEAWWTRRVNYMKAKRENAADMELLREGEERIQVREYDGVLYFGYRGVPLVPVETLKCDVTDALLEARRVYRLWRWDGNGEC